MDMSKQPGIEIKAIMLLKEDFLRIKVIPKNVETNVDFNMTHEKIVDSNDTQIYIKTKLTGKCRDIIDNEMENIVYSLVFDFVGVFSVIPGEKNMDMDAFVKNNAAAIMLPYIREHISSVTQKAGLGVVYLKPINIIAILNQNSSKLKEDAEQ